MVRFPDNIVSLELTLYPLLTRIKQCNTKTKIKCSAPTTPVHLKNTTISALLIYYIYNVKHDIFIIEMIKNYFKSMTELRFI
jgi:hypothetical protein